MSFENATTSLLTLNKEPFPSTTRNLIPSTVIKSNTTTITQDNTKQASKLLLKSALQKANIAVQCDSTNDVLGAMNAYKEAISLLERVLSTVEKENDKQRLQSIHDSYSERIRLLSNITSKIVDTTESIKNMKVVEENNGYKSPSISNSATTIRKIASKSSIMRNTTNSPISLNYWQDNGWSVSQKEMKKHSVSPPPPPIFNLQASKSTPTHSHQLKQKGRCYSQKLQPSEEPPRSRNLYNNDRNSDEILFRPHKFLFRKTDNPKQHDDVSANASNRSSICSVNSCVDIMVEQPSMALPSLKKKKKKNNNNEDTSSNNTKMKAFRLSNSSSSSLQHGLQRSSSMSNVECILVVHDSDESDEPTPPQIYPPQMIINRPAATTSRPTAAVVGGLGSMRRKAVHRLSIDSFTLGRNKEKMSPSVGNDTYNDFFSKTHADEEYMYEETKVLLVAAQNKTISGKQQTQYLKLLFAFEKSMMEGAHITTKLYIPKNLWQQPNIRLSSMDIKIAACQTLIRDISKLETCYLDDLKNALKVLSQVETTVDYVQLHLSKKLKSMTNGSLDNGNGQNTHTASGKDTSFIPVDSNKKSSTFISLGAKLSKSVNAFSLVKTEDQFKNYIDTLQRLFSTVHNLEQWLDYYESARQVSKQTQHDHLITKLVKISTVVNDTIGGFIIQDVTVLLGKWLKRGGSWVYE